MIQYIAYLGILFLSLLSGCDNSSAPGLKNSSENIKVAESKNENTDVNKNGQEERTFDLSKIKLKYPMVWAGSVDFEDGKIKSEVIWSFDEAEIANAENPQIPHNRFRNHDYPFVEKNEVVMVDVMNCAGYLGSGKISYKTINDSMFEWKLTFIKETIAPDALEKAKRCNFTSKSEFISSGAFAIAPQDNKRKAIEIGKVDTKKLFSSLSKETQKWLKNRYGSKVHKSGELSLDSDDWTDIDGDGRIDLIKVWTDTDEEHSRGLILMLINGKWKEIYSDVPA